MSSHGQPPPLPPRKFNQINFSVTDISIDDFRSETPEIDRSPSPAIDDATVMADALANGMILTETPPPLNVITSMKTQNSTISSIDTSFYGLGDVGAKVKTDGRVDITLPPTSPLFSPVSPEIHQAIQEASLVDEIRPLEQDPQAWTKGDYPSIPLNIVIMIVGSRGDVQPFIALGKELKKYGHRVRLATHETFRKFVLDSGLDFYPLGADPAELMAYAVKNPGLIPGIESIRAGDVGKRRQSIKEILETCWDACVKPFDYEPYEPFIAQAIISNPVTFAHIHCAERLGVPLHIFFTMPWSPTRAFPHPLANIQTEKKIPVNTTSFLAPPPPVTGAHSSTSQEDRGRELTSSDEAPLRTSSRSPSPSGLTRTDSKPIQAPQDSASLTNLATYYITDTLAWTGLGDLINDFRKNTLNLPTLSATAANNVVSRLRVPHTYCWSPTLIPKPRDWGDEIDICGFFFLDLATGYTPPQDLQDFLDAGDAPIYIGFGSVVVEDPDALTKTIFEAVEKAGVRAIVSKGWGGLGGDDLKVPPNIYMIGNCPHDWLFTKVAGVVHHGGAGTCATGLRLGRPTFIVPFFGDQPFWGSMVARRGCGPPPIKAKKLNSENLSQALLWLLKPEAREAAQLVAVEMAKENGIEAGVKSFHRHLPLSMMTCDLSPFPPNPSARLSKYVVQVSKKLSRMITISPLAAEALMEAKMIKQRDLHDFEWIEWDTIGEPRTELIQGTLLAVRSMGVDVVKGASNLVSETAVGISGATKDDANIPGEVAKGFGKGVGKAVWFPVKGFGKALGHISDGMRNTPNMIDGSSTQSRAEVNNAGQGFLEGGKALFVGMGEGVYDFFAKPIKGGIQGGWTGAARGIAGGATSLVTKPMAGAIDMVYQTSKGINRSTKDLIDKEGAARRAEARQASQALAIQGPSVDDDPQVTERIKQEFVEKWKEMKAQVKLDKERIREEAKKAEEERKRLEMERKELKKQEAELKKQEKAELELEKKLRKSMEGTR